MKRALVVALLAIGCDAGPRLGVTEQAVFVAEPDSYDFGDVIVGNSDVKTIVVSVDPTDPDGEDDISFALSLWCSEISPAIPDGSVHIDSANPYSLPVTFSPTSGGAFSCDLGILGSDGMQDVSLIGNGVQAEADITLVTGAALAFGDVLLATTSSPQFIVVRNDGAADLNITAVGLVNGVPEFGVLTAGPTALATGGMAQIDITCTPSVEGALSDTYRISSDDPDEPTVDVTLDCFGSNSALFASPAPVVFVETLVGGSDTVSVTLTNSGATELEIESTSIDAPEITSDLADGTLVPLGGGTATFNLDFTPTAHGDISAEMTIVTVAPGPTLHLALNAPGRTAVLTVSPPEPVVDLGTVCVGQIGEKTRFTLRNAGTGAFEVYGVSTSLPEFYGTGITLLPGVLQPVGANLIELDIDFRPTVEGPDTGFFNINTLNPAEVVRVIDLTGIGLASGVGASPTEYDFGSVATGEASVQDFSVINCDAAAILVSSVEITGAGADAYRLAEGDPTSNVGVDPTESVSWTVVFSPDSAGPRDADLVISWDTGSVTIPLSGAGVGEIVDPPDDDDPGRGSYLACRAGGNAGGAAWPLLVALVLVNRRRRRVT